MDDFEKKLLKELYNRGVRYLARDREPSEFYGYLEKPIKGTYYWCGGCAPSNIYSLEIFGDLFTEIKWENDEPFDIGKHLGIIDWSTIPVDTKVLVRDSNNHAWKRAYFAGFDPHEIGHPFLTFTWGRNEWSNNGDAPQNWKQCKLAEEER
ncbi:hypothetical protein [Veillonella intestinalis]|uniref:hypothetical protein n=1 Tax=Veillonella intestinalis TaxID=2941341 RepID=UPI00203ED085|nr:hypothetical protein [Veillonella intestinalis]